MDEKVYLHTIFASKYYDMKSTLMVLEKILRSNAVLSNRNLNLNGYGSFCGLDYISLSDFEKRNDTKDGDYNGYNCFARRNTSIIFPKGEFKVYEPIILSKKITEYSNYLSLMRECGMSEYERYSDLNDEVQAKDSISLDYMSGLMVPCIEMLNFWLKKEKNIDRIKYQLEAYRELLLRYGKDVPLYDSITTECLDTNEGISNCFDTLKLHR